MRVADAETRVGAGVGRAGQHAGARTARAARRGAGDVVEVEGVQRPLQRAQDLVAARLVGRQLAISSRSTSRSRPRCQTSSSRTARSAWRQAVQRLVAGGQPVAQRRRRRTAGQDVGVGGGLDAGTSTCSPPAAGLATGTYWLRGLMPLTAVRSGSWTRRLGLVAGPVADEAEVEDGLDAPAGPLCGHDALGPEPQRGPGRPHGSPTANGS